MYYPDRKEQQILIEEYGFYYLDDCLTIEVPQGDVTFVISYDPESYSNGWSLFIYPDDELQGIETDLTDVDSRECILGIIDRLGD